MGFNLRSLSPLLTTAALAWALLQPPHGAQATTAAPPLTLVSCDRGWGAQAEQWASGGPVPQISNTSLSPGIILQ
jgi:hypothetical protein